MNKLSIKAKLIVAFSIITVLFCTSLVVALSGMQSANVNYDRYFEQNQVLLTELQNMYGDGLLSGIALRNLVLNPSLKKPYKVTPKAIKRFDAGYDKVLSLAKDRPELLANLESVNKSWSLSKNAKLDVLKLMKNGQHDEAVKVLTKKEHPNWRKVRVAIQKIVKQEEELIDSLREQVKSDATKTMTMTITIALIAVLSGLAIAALVIVTIKRSFHQVTSSLEDIAMGEGDLTRRLDDSGKDEVSTLSSAFNKFIERIHAMVSHVSSSTSQLTDAANKMSSISEATLQGVGHQQMETEQAATAMNEMTSTVQEVARNASEASVAANEADQETHSGNSVVSDVVNAIHDLANEVSDSARTINALNEDSEKIGSVLVVIKGIAEQTNLLALNAAIEAARAGEQGRGFAVVADEVRTLASRTQESTQEIQQMIERLQGGAKSAVNAMEKGQEKARSTVERAEQARDVLSHITEAVSKIVDMNTHIATAAEEQSSVAEEINRNVVNVNEISSQTADGAQQISQSSHELSRLSSDLQELVGSFKL